MAKIAVELQRAIERRDRAGERGDAVARVLAEGDGWRAADVVCTSGPDDRPFEERHAGVSIAIVAAGTFQYRTSTRPQLLTPGSFLLGNAGDAYECAHDHARGDRCISFQFRPDVFERLVAPRTRFRTPRLPPHRASSPLVARACAALAGATAWSWEELAVEAAACAAQLAGDAHAPAAAPPHAFAKVTRAVREIEADPEAALPLQQLAAGANLSPYHFLRTFRSITGVTPHQFALRVRLREAALRLTTTDARVIDVALDSGFGDVSNFNRAFRAELGVSPRTFRRSAGR